MRSKIPTAMRSCSRQKHASEHGHVNDIEDKLQVSWKLPNAVRI